MDVTSPDEPDPQAAAVTVGGVTAPIVADVRHRVTEAARRAGLDAEQAGQFTTAVNEIVINAIRHGGGSADVTITTKQGRIEVAVRDHGRGRLTNAPTALPPPQQLGGRGLWLVRHLCDDVTIDTTSTGVVVTLSAAAPQPAASQP